MSERTLVNAVKRVPRRQKKNLSRSSTFALSWARQEFNFSLFRLKNSLKIPIPIQTILNSHPQLKASNVTFLMASESFLSHLFPSIASLSSPHNLISLMDKLSWPSQNILTQRLDGKNGRRKWWPDQRPRSIAPAHTSLPAAPNVWS